MVVKLRPHFALVLVVAVCVMAARPTPAQAFSVKPVCDVAGLVSGLLGKACSLAQGGAGRFLGAGKQLLGGHIGSALKTALGDGASAVGTGATAALGLAAIGAWVLGGAKFVLHEAAKALGQTTAPHLDSSWFSATYWRVAGIAALLTLPFLFAASVQALTRSDLALLLRAALGYLPLAMLAVTVAAPVATLLLSGSDELSTLVSSATGQQTAQALSGGIGLAGGLTLFTGSPFFVFFFALLTAARAMVLWMELLMREAAVYVVVLMLPLAFAALVWPARRVWAIRAVELLVALILSKFAIVAVLSLGGAAVDQIGHSITASVLGLVLVAMAAFSPWVLLRLLPLAEVASSAAATLRGEARGALGPADWAARTASGGEDWATRTVAGMRRVADDVRPPVPAGGPAGAASDAASQPEHAAPPDEDPSPQDITDLAPDVDSSELDTADVPGGEDQDVPGLGPDGMRPAGDSASGPDEPPLGTTSTEQRERLPGLSARWQAEDLSWRPLELGTEKPRPWPPDDGEGSPVPELDEAAEDTAGLPPSPEASPWGESAEVSGLPPADVPPATRSPTAPPERPERLPAPAPPPLPAPPPEDAG